MNKAKKATKASLREETLQIWNDKIKKLVMQGDFVQLLAEEKENVTWKSIAFNIPKGILSFALKASTNALNTPDNLRRWGKRKLANCNLCGNHGTLLHILNFCKTSLNQKRFMWRHDSIINLFASTINEGKPETLTLYADIPEYRINGGTIPADILCTLERPDIVILDRNLKKIYLLELTCSFENNIESAHISKRRKYQDLKKDLEAQKYSVTLLPFEIGSRGYVTKRNRTELQNIFKLTQTKVKSGNLFKGASKIALLCSFAIFNAREEPAWQDPPYLSP